MNKNNTPNLKQLISSVFRKSKPANTPLAILCVAAGTVGIPASSLVDAKPIAEKNGTTLIEGIRDFPQGKKCNYIIYCALSLLLSLIGARSLLKKDGEYAAAEYIVKHKLQQIAGKNTELHTDSETLKSIADLLAANMDKNDRDYIAHTARDFVKNMRTADFYTDDDLKKGAKIIAIKQIEDIINRVIARNPGLVNIIISIAKGELMYNPTMFAKAKSNEYQGS